MKQLGLASINYADESGGYMYKYYDGSNGVWMATLIKAQKIRLKMFLCPSKYSRNTNATWLRQLEPLAITNPTSSSFFFVHYGVNTLLSGFKINQAKKPSETLVMTDVYYTAIPEYGYYVLAKAFQGPSSIIGQLDARHSNAVNTLRLDGHANAVKVPVNYDSPYVSTLNPYLFQPFSNFSVGFVWQPK